MGRSRCGLSFWGLTAISVGRLVILGILASARARVALRWRHGGGNDGFSPLADGLEPGHEPTRTGYGVVVALVLAVVEVSTGADADLAGTGAGVGGWPSRGRGEQAGNNEERSLETHIAWEVEILWEDLWGIDSLKGSPK